MGTVVAFPLSKRCARAVTWAALACLSAQACKSKGTSTSAPLAPGSTDDPVPAAPEARRTMRPADKVLEPVASVSLEQLRPAAFADDELDLPYYLAHFATLANAVESSGPNRGYINIAVWRSHVTTHNARVMENVLSLAWFYTQKRAWNPYYAAPALRARLEAALTFWSDAQGPDGQFTEYEPGIFGLAPTAFATKFFGEALVLLRRGPAVDAAVLARAEDTLAKAVRVTLSLPAMYTTGRSFSNQFGNVWGGGLALFSLRQDAPLRTLWDDRFRQSQADFQSPAGFYYEGDGPDFEYTMHTHGHSVRQAWEWLRGTPLGQELSTREAAWFDWLALNALPEPAGGFILNAAISTRKTLDSFRSYDTPLAEFVPAMRAFAESVEELDARRKAEREKLTAEWPRVPPLAIGEASSFSPYAFLHRRLKEWRPTTAERDIARRGLPALARQHFTIQRRDNRKNATFSFVRRPGYYATFASGERAVPQQRYGLGLVWSPRMGTVLKSHPGTDRGAWGTVAPGKTLSEAGNLKADFSAADSPISSPGPGIQELPAGSLTASYALGTAGKKRVKFDDASITVNVELAGQFEEFLPLLVPADGKVNAARGLVTLTTPRGRATVRFEAGATATIEPPTGDVLGKKLVLVRLQAKDKLAYSLTLE